jgi:hypothetical protein
MFIIPHVALDSSMACRVFRGLKLGLIEDVDDCSMQVSSMRCAQNSGARVGVLSNTHQSSLPKVPVKAVRIGDRWKADFVLWEHDDEGKDAYRRTVLSGWV